MSYNYTTSPTQVLLQTVVQSANITSYNPTTKTITLDAPINTSLGYNSVYGQITSTYNITGISLNTSHFVIL